MSVGVGVRSDLYGRGGVGLYVGVGVYGGVVVGVGGGAAYGFADGVRVDAYRPLRGVDGVAYGFAGVRDVGGL